jgi:hypothetical protein
LERNFMAPVLVRQQAPKTQEDTEAAITERVAFCPKCKTLETLCFTNDVLMSTAKFYQQNGRVYHDCGAYEPCRLYRTF